MSKNDICPITLEPVRNLRDVFYHCEIAMDVDALYLYLVKAIYFLNPVTRVPFELEDLVRLEQAIRARHGMFAIQKEPDVSSLSTTDSVMVSTMVDISETDVLTRMHIIVDEEVSRRDMVRVHVEVDVPDPPVVTRVVPEETTMVVTTTIPENHQDMVFPLPSVVSMYLDKGRERRLKERLDIVQYLCTEGTHILNEMIQVCDDTYWHEQVWQQTSESVIDTVTQFIREQNHLPLPPEEDMIAEISFDNEVVIEEVDLQLEVRYSECWEVYRAMIQHVLEKKYFITLRDLHQIDVTEAQLLLRLHLNEIQESNQLIRQILLSVQTHLELY